MRGRSQNQKWDCVWYLQFFSVQVHQLEFFSLCGNDKVKAFSLVCHLFIKRHQEALFHSTLNLGNSVVKCTLCFIILSVNLEVTQASLAHVSFPKMSHMDTLTSHAMKVQWHGRTDVKYYTFERTCVFYWIKM